MQKKRIHFFRKICASSVRNRRVCDRSWRLFNPLCALPLSQFFAELKLLYSNCHQLFHFLFHPNFAAVASQKVLHSADRLTSFFAFGSLCIPIFRAFGTAAHQKNEKPKVNRQNFNEQRQSIWIKRREFRCCVFLFSPSTFVSVKRKSSI